MIDGTNFKSEAELNDHLQKLFEAGDENLSKAPIKLKKEQYGTVIPNIVHDPQAYTYYSGASFKTYHSDFGDHDIEWVDDEE